MFAHSVYCMSIDPVSFAVNLFKHTALDL